MDDGADADGGGGCGGGGSEEEEKGQEAEKGGLWGSTT